jgi:LCP family protein required for cell wall assembly
MVPTITPTAGVADTEVAVSPTTSPPTLTLTPAPSDTPVPTSRPTPLPTAALEGSPVYATVPPETPQPLPIPPPMPVLEQSEGTINVVLLGADQSADRYSGRTDVIVVVSIDPALPSVSLLSIPRDYYAWIPTHGFNKINSAYRWGEVDGYPGGGGELVKATIEYNFGIHVHYYALADFDGFIRIVDALGGVDVAVECPLSDTFPDDDSPLGETDVDWLPGIHHLDGKHALWYARSRWSTHDFDRNRRQQQVLRGLYHQALALDVLPKIPELWPTLNETVSTDLGLEDLIYLASIGAELNMLDVKSAFVGTDVVQQWTAPNGAWVLVPYYEAIGPMVEEALAPPARARAAQPAFRVEIWNGASEEGLGHVAAERLRWEGFEVLSVQRAETAYERTQIYDFTTTSKGSPLPHLMYLYQRYAGDVISQPNPDRAVDFRVVLGADYDSCLSAKSRWRPGGPEPLPTPTALPTPIPTPAQ